MDKLTIDTYNLEAEQVAKLHAGLTPTRLYALVTEYFTKNILTLDVGCGIGRDTNWLNQQGYPAIGIDASEGMLNQAKQLYPDVKFIKDTLPDLKTLNEQCFKNILCSAVLMHLNQETLYAACLRLITLLEPAGHLIISIRNTKADNHRENGKLYEDIDIAEFKDFFMQQHCQILIAEQETESARQLTWYNFVIKK
ncbi:MAG: class I SAM-dependent methyltransferase [Methylococcales bacterium]|nr:class I SAM-dependent methyltransferase [Methylococcales bacterium]